MKEIETKVSKTGLNKLLNCLEELKISDAVFELKNNELHYKGIEPSQICMAYLKVGTEKSTGETEFAVSVEAFKKALSCFNEYAKISLKIGQSIISLQDEEQTFELAREEVKKTDLPNPKSNPIFIAELSKESFRTAIKNAIKVGYHAILENDKTFFLDTISRLAKYHTEIKIKPNVSNKLGKIKAGYPLEYLNICSKAISDIKIEFGDSQPLHLLGNIEGKKAEFWIAPINLEAEPIETGIDEEMD
jgi:hypothetical protein